MPEKTQSKHKREVHDYAIPELACRIHRAPPYHGLASIRSSSYPAGQSTPVTSLDELLSDVRRCTLCADLPLGPRPVVQVSCSARILIASQALGRKLHESGIPFDDPSGKRLREWMGVTPDQFYDPELIALLPMSFCFPGAGKSGDLPPRAECAPAWRESLLAQLPNVQLTIVLGMYAQAYHLSDTRQDEKATLTERVRRWEDYWPLVIPLPHPSPRNSMWLRRNPWFEEHVLPALRDRIAALLVS